MGTGVPDARVWRTAACDWAITAALALVPLVAISLAVGAALDAALPFVGQVCHRIPERSFAFADGSPFPVCARCTGLYAGALVGALISRFAPVATTVFPRSWWLGLSVAVLGLADGIGHVLGLWDESNHVRLLTGAALGGGAFYLAGAVARTLVHDAREGRA